MCCAGVAPAMIDDTGPAGQRSRLV